jgi:hypothetical protein
MYASSRGRNSSTSPVGPGGTGSSSRRSSSRTARGSASKRKSRGGTAKSGYAYSSNNHNSNNNNNINDPASPSAFASSFDETFSPLQQQHFAHPTRRSGGSGSGNAGGPPRKWVEVMRPPAPHIQFRIATWVPWDDLTDVEREEYETIKERQQQEELQYELELQAVQEAQEAHDDQRKVTTSNNNKNTTTEESTTTPKTSDHKEDGPVPMSISPEKGDDTSGNTNKQETIETTAATTAASESGSSPSPSTTMTIIHSSTPTPQPIPSKEESQAVDSERLVEATLSVDPIMVPFPEATDVEESRNHKKRKIEISEIDLSDSITTSLNNSTTTTAMLDATTTTTTPPLLPPLPPPDLDQQQGILAPGQAALSDNIMSEQPTDQETMQPLIIPTNTLTTTASSSTNSSSLTTKAFMSESTALIGFSTARLSLMPSAATMEDSAALAAGDAAATSTITPSN